MRWLCLFVFISFLAAPRVSHAQLDPELAELNAEDDDADDEALDLDVDEEATTDADPEPTDEEVGGESDRLDLDPAEDPNEPYFFLGWSLRGMIAPEFLLEAFLGSSPRVADWSTGAEFTYRRDGFDIVTSVWWAGYRFQGPIRDKGDPIQDTEWVDSNWSALLTTVSLLWDTQFTDQWALQYGFDIGLAWLIGTMYRSEAYQQSDGSFAPCERQGVPDAVFCEPVTNPVPGSDPQTTQDNETGAHYHVKQRRWTQGGNAPTFVPWLAARLSLRYKPIKQLMTRADVGIGLGMYLGLSAAYGF